jgi:LysR family transcriptional regulator, nod-box dependent transcriptional activator
MRFKGLDLNLLVTLEVLLAECSVSRAAERLHLSQPSVSAALARLREYFGDPLLEVQGKRMVPTPQALQLRATLAQVLASVDQLLIQTRHFDPASSERVFHLCVSDYLSTVLFPRLVPQLEAAAPGIRLELYAPSEAALEQLGQGQIDVALMPQEHCLPDHPAQLLFEERFVVVGWSGNPRLQAPLDEEAFFAAGHVAVRVGSGGGRALADDELRKLPRERRVQVVAASFTQVPELLIGTQRITVMHERLARTLAERLPLRLQPLPFEFPVMREMIQYHRSRAADASLAWLVARLREAAQD